MVPRPTPVQSGAVAEWLPGMIRWTLLGAELDFCVFVFCYKIPQLYNSDSRNLILNIL